MVICKAFFSLCNWLFYLKYAHYLNLHGGEWAKGINDIVIFVKKGETVIAI